MMRLRACLLAICVLACLYGGKSSNIRGGEVNGKCRVLVLSGGGDKASYEAGVLDVLTAKLPAEERSWHIISGVSAGALNAAPSTAFPVGEEPAWVNLLKKTWLELSADKVYKSWPAGLPEGILFKGGVYDNSPLKSEITQILSPLKQYDRNVLITAINMNKGEYQVWRETVGIPAMIEATFASTCIPGVFPPHAINKTAFGDDGILAHVNIADAVGTCLSEGRVTDEKDIIVDIIVSEPAVTPYVDVTKETTIPVLLRMESIRNFAGSIRSIERAKITFPNVQWRYLVYPKIAFPGRGLSFKHDEIIKMMNQGREDAKNIIDFAEAQKQRKDPSESQFDEKLREALEIIRKDESKKEISQKSDQKTGAFFPTHADNFT